ncbi:ydr124wp-like protein [Stemphylium lycopersici]|uniref:Ydr124wp-like protein n=1 Tax=Stemphylium lycopersici TaxID=183478 RepID=A0A364MWG3_STELY|nr:ydr124wp-like protein [Stemphylium lycopersici]
MEEHGQDAWVDQGHDDVSGELAAKEQYAVPTPIAGWKVTSPNGREEVRQEPISGFEHLCSGVGSGVDMLQGAPGFVSSPETASLQLYQPAIAQIPVIPRELQDNRRKRTRSSRRGLRSQHPAPMTSDDDEQYCRDVTIATEQSYTFYIGDIDELKRFFRRRLDELTMKPVRPIVTAWIKQLEPKRLSRYGPYHKKLPKEQPEECTPPWWPRDVPYEEPSHLDKGGLLTLAVDVMLQHRLIDKDKRKAPWIAKLRQAARYAVETTPPDQFSSSKGSGFSERMQGRALAEILPNLFDIAQLYEDHFAYWKHYEGSGNPGPGKGTRVTWKPLTRPARQPVAPRKRVRRSKASQGSRSGVVIDASGHESEVDDTLVSSYSRNEQQVHQQLESPHDCKQRMIGQQALISSRGAVTARPERRSRSTATTPRSSFGQTMRGLRMGEEADLDVRRATRAPVHDEVYAQGSQGLPYATGHPYYHGCPVQAPQGASSLHGMAQPNFVPACMPEYQHPHPAFESPYPHVVDSVPSYDTTGLPYEYGMYAPPRVHSFEFLDGMPSDGDISRRAETYHPYSPVI